MSLNGGGARYPQFPNTPIISPSRNPHIAIKSSLHNSNISISSPYRTPNQSPFRNGIQLQSPNSNQVHTTPNQQQESLPRMKRYIFFIKDLFYQMNNYYGAKALPQEGSLLSPQNFRKSCPTLFLC